MKIKISLICLFIILILLFQVVHAASNATLKEDYARYASSCNFAKIKLLIEQGVDINTRDKAGYTALMYASMNGRLDIVTYLIENGADVNLEDEYGTTALFFAQYYGESGYPDIVKLLKAHGAKSKDENYKFIWACSDNRIDEASKWLKQGANINAQLPDGHTALMLASEYGYIDIVKFLINLKADINKTGSQDNSALWLAVDRNRIDIVKLLISHGANVNARCSDGGGSVLYWAKIKKNNPIIKALLDAGAKE